MTEYLVALMLSLQPNQSLIIHKTAEYDCGNYECCKADCRKAFKTTEDIKFCYSACSASYCEWRGGTQSCMVGTK